MARTIYTVGGHLATLYNNTTGLSGVEVTDPDIILRYYTRDTAQTGARYDGITYEGRLVDTTNACYYSTQLYAKPKLSDLTAAQFVSASELTAYGTFPQGGNYRTDGTYYFPYDVNPIGCYVIPKSAYSGDKELYVYIWLPSIESNPTDDDATYPDATMLAMESVGMDIIKCHVKNVDASWMFNQTYISSMSGVNIASQDVNFGVGNEYPDSASYPLISIHDSNIPRLNHSDPPSVYYTYVDNCSGTLYVDDFKSGYHTPDIINSNLYVYGSTHQTPQYLTMSATTATIGADGNEISVNASACDLNCVMSTTTGCVTAISSNITVGYRWYHGTFKADHSFIDLREQYDEYTPIENISAQYCTLSGKYNVMIDYYHPRTTFRKLVECTGYDPYTHKVWYFENYPTIAPVDITPKTLQVDLVASGGSISYRCSIDLSAENYTTSYTANSYENSSFTTDANVHLPIYAKASFNDDLFRTNFSGLNVSGLDATDTFRAATISESGYITGGDEYWSYTSAFSAIYV